MVGVAQLVERWIVAPVVEGSSPFTHPRHPVEKLSTSVSLYSFGTRQVGVKAILRTVRR